MGSGPTVTRNRTACALCRGKGKLLRTPLGAWKWCPRCCGAKQMTFPHEGDLVVFWRHGRVKVEKAVHWEVVSGPADDDWEGTVTVRSQTSGRRQTTKPYRLYVVREVEERVADLVMGEA